MGTVTYGKTYVSVQAIHGADGDITPIQIRTANGTVYHIRSARELDAVPSERNVRTWKVRINGKYTELYCEGERWFVQMRS